MSDIHHGTPSTLGDPGELHYQITPNDTVPLNPKPRSIYCRVNGDVVIEDKRGTALTYSMTAGDVLPFRGHLVKVTGTTGTFYAWN